MKEEIKQRIELIKNGQVPQGYKKTKVGILPEDWEIKKLINLSIGKGMYGINAPGCDYNENLPLYLRITDIDDFGKYRKENRVCVSDKESYKFYLKENDLLFARTGATTGKTYLYNKDDGELVFAGFLIKFSINNKISNSYVISQYCKTNRYWNWVNIFSTRSGQPGINAEEYAKLKLPYTKNLNEQQKIADILTTQDKIIELKQKLIEEKEKQKKYLMQNLLTGKIRLKGFNDKWEKVIIGKIFTVTRGNVISLNKLKQIKDDEFSYPVYSSQTKNKGLLGYYKEYLYEDAITWTTDGANAGDVNFRKDKFYCTNVCGVLLSKKGNANICIAEILNKVTKKYVSYVGNPKLMNNVMENIKIKIPPLQEQNAIAQILSKADEEIELLQKELEQEKQKKKALMQLLLTGIVRV